MISRRTRNDTDVELGGDATAPEQDDKVIVGSDGFIEWGDPIAGSVLCVSSAAFLGSTSMVYTLGVYSGPAMCLSAVAVATFLVSVNYWRRAVKGTIASREMTEFAAEFNGLCTGFRRNVDVVMARTSFAMHMFISGLFFRDACAAFLACLLGVLSVTMFWLAGRLYKMRTRAWVAGHVAFHCCVGLNMMMCIMAMERPNLQSGVIRQTPFIVLEHLVDSFATHLYGC